jgi:chromosome segregation ATPase
VYLFKSHDGIFVYFQDLLETRHVLLEQLDNAHFLKEAQQEQILSLNTNKDQLEEKMLKLQAELEKYTGETSIEKAAELDKDEWRIKYDRLLSDHKKLKSNVWGESSLGGAEVEIPKSPRLQELWQLKPPTPMDIPVWGESGAEGVETPKHSLPSPAKLPVWGESGAEDMYTSLQQSPGSAKLWKLPSSEGAAATIPELPRPGEVLDRNLSRVLDGETSTHSLNLISTMPQNTEGNFCFEDDLNTVNEPSFVADSEVVVETGFERPEEAISDPVFKPHLEAVGYSPVEDKVKKEYRGRKIRSSSRSSTKAEGEYLSVHLEDPTLNLREDEGQYISEIKQTENDLITEGQEEGQYISESPSDIAQMRENMFKYARENDALRSEIEALLSKRDSPLVSELKSELHKLEDENTSLLSKINEHIHDDCGYEILEQKYIVVCEELRQLKQGDAESDLPTAYGGFTLDDVGYAQFQPESDDTVGQGDICDGLKRPESEPRVAKTGFDIGDKAGSLPIADDSLINQDVTAFDQGLKSDEAELVPVLVGCDEYTPNRMEFENLQQKYSDVCNELEKLKEEMAQQEPELGMMAEHTGFVPDTEHEKETKVPEELGPTFDPVLEAPEQGVSFDTGYASFVPDVDAEIGKLGEQKLQAPVSQFFPEHELPENATVLESLKEQVPLHKKGEAMGSRKDDQTDFTHSEEKVHSLQNEFEKYKSGSSMAYEELFNVKADLDRVVAKQNIELLELDGLRKKNLRLDEVNVALSDEVAEKEKEFIEKISGLVEEKIHLKTKLEEASDDLKMMHLKTKLDETNDELKKKAEYLEELEGINEELKMMVDDLEEKNEELKKHNRTLADELGKLCDQNMNLQRELAGWATLQEPANPDHIFWPIAGEALAIDEMELGPSQESSGFDVSSMEASEFVMKTIGEKPEGSIGKEQFLPQQKVDQIILTAQDKDVPQDEPSHSEKQVLPESIQVVEAVLPETVQSLPAPVSIVEVAEEQPLLERNLGLLGGLDEEQRPPVQMSTPRKEENIDESLQESSEVSDLFVTPEPSSLLEDTYATAVSTPRSMQSFSGRFSLGGHSDSTGELLAASCIPDFGKSLSEKELSASLQKLSDQCDAYKTKQMELEEQLSRCNTPVQELSPETSAEDSKHFQQVLATLKDEKVELKSLNEGLRDITEQLKRKNAQLLKKNDDLEIKNMNLEVEVEALRTRVNELEIELERYFKNNGKLTKKNKDLSSKCDRLESLLANRLSEMKKPMVRDSGLTRRSLFSPSKRPSDITEDVTVIEKERLHDACSTTEVKVQKKGPRDEPLLPTLELHSKEEPSIEVGQGDGLDKPIVPSSKQDSPQKPVVPRLPLEDGDKFKLTERWVSEHSLNSPTEGRDFTNPLKADQESAKSRLDVAQDKYQQDMNRLENDLKQLEDHLSESDLDKPRQQNGALMGKKGTVAPSRFYEELSQLRRVLQETKDVYNQENLLLKAALEHERFSHVSDATRSSAGARTPHQMLSPRTDVSQHDTTPRYNYPADYLALREKVTKLQESNHDLIGQLNDQSRRLHDQEKMVQDLKDHLDTSDIVTSEVQQVFTHQLAMLQTQRDYLESKVWEQRGKEVELAEVMGDKLILEENLRREKELLRHIMHEKEVQEVELIRSKAVAEEKERGHRRLQNLLREKDKLEADLIQQKQTLQDELSSIEGSLISRSGRNRQDRDQAVNDWQASKGSHYRTSTPAKESPSLDSTIQSPSGAVDVVHSAAGDFDYQHSVLSEDSTRSDRETLRRLHRLRMESEVQSDRALERLKSRFDTVRLNKEHSADILKWRNSRRPNNTYSSF